MGLSKTEINLRRLLAAAPQQQNQEKLVHYVATLREQLEQLAEERTPDGVPRISKATVNGHSQKIEAVAAKLAAPAFDTQASQEPVCETLVIGRPSKIEEEGFPSSPGLRRRNVPSPFKDKASDTVGASQSAPVKLDSAAQAHILKHRLAGWKKQYLSKGGRLVLIKSTLSSLPMYFMSMFVMPMVVVQRLEKLERDFLWGGQAEERKYHLIRLEVVCTNVRSGGLGIKKLKLFNMALLGKWLWRYLKEEGTLWKTVVSSEFGAGEQMWVPGEVHTSYGVGVWKGIRKRWELVKRFISFEVGNGKSVSFWRDKWCGDTELRRAFPSLYSLSTDKDSTVSSVLLFLGDNVIWNPVFRG